jgi:hypothetical protein
MCVAFPYIFTHIYFIFTYLQSHCILYIDIKDDMAFKSIAMEYCYV